MSKAKLVPNDPEIIKVPIEKLRPAPWNYKVDGTPEEIEHLKESIMSSKSAGVLCVREITDKKKKLFEVLDGNHRLEAIKLTGWKTVNVENFGPITKAAAVVIARQRNHQWFKDDVVKLSKLYTDDVLAEFDKTELIGILPESEGAFDNILAMADLKELSPPDDKSEPPPPREVIKLTHEQWLTVQMGIEKIKESDDGGPDLSDGRALELLVADWLAGE